MNVLLSSCLLLSLLLNIVTKDEMVGWHHRLNGYESEQTLMGKDREA